MYYFMLKILQNIKNKECYFIFKTLAINCCRKTRVNVIACYF